MRYSYILIFLIFATLGFSLYYHTLENPFVLDDEEQIVLNPMVHSLENLESAFEGSTMNSGDDQHSAGIYYKPIMSISNMVLWSFFGGKPVAFHLFQLSIHILNTFLLFLLFYFFLSLPLSLGFSLLFLVHPINSENVLYSANLQDVLFLFFGLLASLFYLKFSFQELAKIVSLQKNSLRTTSMLTTSFQKRSSFLFLVAGGFFSLLSILSKESGVLFILINGFILNYFVREKKALLSNAGLNNAGISNVGLSLDRFFGPLKFSKMYFYLLPPVGVYLYLRIEVANLISISPPIVKIGQINLWERLLTLPKIILYYFSTFVYPDPITLVQDWVVSEVNWSGFLQPLILVSLLLFLFLRIWVLIRKDSYQFAADLFFLMLILGLGLHSQILPLDGTVATRWFYFPMIGLLGFVALFLELLQRRYGILRKRSSLVIILILFAFKIFLLSALTYKRSKEWYSALSLYTVEVERQPDLYFIQNNLGVELYRIGKVLDAHKLFEKATQLAPTWPIGWNNLGSTWQAQGDLLKAERSYLRAIDLSPYYMAYENYALLLYKQKKMAQLKIFLEDRALKNFAANPILVQLLQQTRMAF